MDGIVLDVKEHELARIALKGEMLKAFLTAAQNNTDMTKLGLSDDVPLVVETNLPRLLEIRKTLINYVTEVFPERAIFSGIDSTDLANILRQAVEKKLPPTEKNPEEDELRSNAMASLINFFGMHVVVQEQKQELYLQALKAHMDHEKERIASLKHDTAMSTDKANDMVILSTAVFLLTEQMVRVAKETNSPVSNLYNKILEGDDGAQVIGIKGLLGHAIATFGDIDVATRAGQFEMNRIRDHIIGDMRREMGLGSAGLSA